MDAAFLKLAAGALAALALVFAVACGDGGRVPEPQAERGGQALDSSGSLDSLDPMASGGRDGAGPNARRGGGSAAAGKPAAPLAMRATEIVPPKYDWVESFANGLAVVRLGDWLGGKWGAIDRTGREAIPVIYDSVSMAGEFVLASRGGTVETTQWGGPALAGSLWGVLDSRGNEVLPFVYDAIFVPEGSGIAVVSAGEWPDVTQGLVELSTGRVIVPTGLYRAVTQIRAEEGLAVVYVGNWPHEESFWGVIDLFTGEVIVPPTYSFIMPFSEGFAPVHAGGERGEGWGFIDRHGNEITQMVFGQNSGPFAGGFAPALYGGKWGLIGAGGEWVLQPEFDSLHWEWLSFARQTEVDFVAIPRGGLFGIFDRNGQEVLPPAYGHIVILNNERALAGSGDWDDMGYKIIDIRTGRYVSQRTFSGFHSVLDGGAAFVASAGARGGDGHGVGVADAATGKTVIDFVYDEIRELCGSMLAVRTGARREQGHDGWHALGGHFGIVDMQGREIAPPIYGLARSFSPGIAEVAVGTAQPEEVSWGWRWAPFDGRRGLVGANGETVLALEYDYIGWPGDGGLAVANIGGQWTRAAEGDGLLIETGRWGFIDSGGNIAVPAELDYDFVERPSEGMAAVERGGKWGFVSLDFDSAN